MAMSFVNFITPTKNVHLPHLEDVIFDGLDGVMFVVKMLRQFGVILDGRVSRTLSVSVKWDGAPSLVFGPDPADGRFFVSTKAAFSATPKLAKSHADIDWLFSANLAKILHVAFRELPYLNARDVLQGDLLYTRAMLEELTIEGVRYLTFQPNTIRYAVASDSQIADEMRISGMGIALHTQYTGDGLTLSSYGATSLSPSVYTFLSRTPRVVTLDATYDDLSGNVSFASNMERMDYVFAYTAVREAVAKLDARVYDIVEQEPFHTLLHAYLNFLVRTNQTLSPRAMVGDLLLFTSARGEREMRERKSLAGQQNQSAKYLSVMDDILRYERHLTGFFTLHAAITRAKSIVIGKLTLNTPFKTFVPTDAGFRPTGPEGFVAEMNGKIVKLVDRMEFSRLNFNTPKNWQ